MLESRKKVKRGKALKFRTVLALGILAPLFLVGALASFAVGSGAEKSVREAVAALGDETVSNLESRVAAFLETPMRVNEMNVESVLTRRVGYDDPATLESLFLSRVRYTPSVTSVYFGNARGGLVNVGREGPGGSLYAIGTDGFAAGTFRKHAIDEKGRKLSEVSSLARFDARERPWFRTALAAGRAAWTEPYLLFTGQDRAISAVHPVYDAGGKLLGVFSVDIFLSQLGAFFGEAASVYGGYCFIVDGSGAPIASSRPVPDSAFMEAEALRLAPAGKAARYVFSKGKTSYYANVASLPAELGLDWRIFVVYPDTAFFAKLRANTANTVAAVTAVALLGFILAILIAYLFGIPLVRLAAYSRSISEGSWPEPPRASRLYETEELRRTLVKMGAELKKNIGQLETLVKEKELILREVHHRIKNNMSSIAGLLSLEAGLQKDEQSASSLHDAESRVVSMMVLYDKLYRSASFTESDAASYLSDIADGLAEHLDPGGRILLEKNLEPVTLPAGLLMPLGIIANEALTNAYKYAFAGTTGKLSISFEAEGGRALLTIADDGSGIVSERRPDGFGFELIEGLALQVGGELSIDGAGGTRIRVSFPLRS